MDTKIRFIALILLSIWCEQALFAGSHLYRIKDDSIHAHSQTIKAMLYRHSLLKACITGGVALTSFICFYRWLFHEKSSCAEIPSQSVENIPSIQEPQDWFFTRLMHARVHGIKEKCTYETARSIGYNIFYLSGRYIVSAEMIKYAFHAHTISWYIKNHARYEDTIALIQEYLVMLANELTVEEQEYYRTSVCQLITVLIDQCERICGYIHYYSAGEPESIQCLCAGAISCITSTVNTWSDILVSLSDQEQVYDRGVIETKKLAETLAREIKKVKYSSRVEE